MIDLPDWIDLTLKVLSVVVLPAAWYIVSRFKGIEDCRQKDKQEFNDKLHKLEISMTDKISRDEAARMIHESNADLKVSVDKLTDVIWKHFSSLSGN